MKAKQQLTHSMIAILLLVLQALRTSAWPLNLPQPENVVVSTNNVKSRRSFLSRLSLPVIATIGILTTIPPSGNAEEDTTRLNYQGVYNDPNHPNGYRVLYGDDNGKSATLKLQDQPNTPIYELPVQVDYDVDKNKKQVIKSLIFDLSPKGGPKDVQAILDDKGNLQFPHGNVWTRDTSRSIIGVYQDEPDLFDFIVIRKRPLSTAELMVELIQKGQDTIIFGCKAGSQKAFFEYPGEFNKAGFLDNEAHTITFRDGNVWIRY